MASLLEVNTERPSCSDTLIIIPLRQVQVMVGSVLVASYAIMVSSVFFVEIEVVLCAAKLHADMSCI